MYLFIPTSEASQPLTFRLQGHPDAGFDWYIRSNRGDVIIDAEPDIEYFYGEIVEMIKIHGTATVLVGGRSDPSTKIEMDLLFQVNAYVSY